MNPETQVQHIGQVLMVTQYPWGLEFEVVRASGKKQA